jgi:pectate lyase
MTKVCLMFVLFLLVHCGASLQVKEPLTGPEPAAPSISLTTVPVGFASLNGGTTGGAGGETFKVSSLAELNNATLGDAPRIIYIVKSFNLGYGIRTEIGSNKTIIGYNNVKLRYGGFNLKNVRNVIIRNIEFHDAITPYLSINSMKEITEFDAIQIEKNSVNIWVDHCTFTDAPELGDARRSLHHDGLLDIKTGSDFVTVSYCRFESHDKTCLLGHDDYNGSADSGRLHVTYHHNWFNGTTQRHPRVRFAETHIYNNYYSGVTLYGIGVGVEAKIYSESNFFEDVKSPIRYYDSVANGAKRDAPGYIRDSGSYPKIAATRPEGVTWEPSKIYKYTADSADRVKDICIKHSGAGNPDR